MSFPKAGTFSNSPSAQENWLAFATAALLYSLSLYFAFAFDRDKRKYDIQTYREVSPG